jgi:hypothetical protein
VAEWSSDSYSGPGVQLVSRIAPDGSAYDVVPISGYGIPRAVALGSDGAVWFTIGSSLARLDPERGSCEFLSPPWQTPWMSVEVGAITISADGTVWIGAITGASGHIAGYSPTTRDWIDHEIPGGFPNQLAVDADGVLWFADFHHSQAGRISPENQLTRAHIPGHPFGIAAAGDEIWITEFAASRVTRLDRETVQPVESLPLPIGSEPQAVGVGPTGELWVTLQTGGVCRLSRRGSATLAAPAEPVTIAVAAPRMFPRPFERDAPPIVRGTQKSTDPSTSPIRVNYSSHPSFHEPGDDLTIWRYIDLPRLVAMLDERALFFARLDTLADRFEGSFPARAEDDSALGAIGLSPDNREAIRQHLSLHRQALSNFRPRALINCWHISEHESMAMWEIYARSGSGIAIRSTPGRLRASLDRPYVDDAKTMGKPGGPDAPMYVGAVRYLDYDKDVVLPATALDYITCKRKSYEHERELRAVVLSVTPVETGQNVECDIGLLTTEIRVSPLASQWFTASVQSVVTKYGLDRTVAQSDLKRDPVP